MALILAPDTPHKPSFLHFPGLPEKGSGERARNLLRDREALAGCRGGEP